MTLLLHRHDPGIKDALWHILQHSQARGHAAGGFRVHGEGHPPSQLIHGAPGRQAPKTKLNTTNNTTHTKHKQPKPKESQAKTPQTNKTKQKRPPQKVRSSKLPSPQLSPSLRLPPLRCPTSVSDSLCPWSIPRFPSLPRRPPPAKVSRPRHCTTHPPGSPERTENFIICFSRSQTSTYYSYLYTDSHLQYVNSCVTDLSVRDDLITKVMNSSSFFYGCVCRFGTACLCLVHQQEFLRFLNAAIPLLRKPQIRFHPFF